MTVVAAKNLKGDGKNDGYYYDGFFVVVKVDPRYYWLTEDEKIPDHYQLLVRSSNSLLLKVPAWDYDMRLERDELSVEVDAGRVHAPLLDGVDTALDALRLEEKNSGVERARMYTYLELKIKGVTMDGSILDDDFDPEKQELLPFKVDFTASPKAYWMIARTDTAPYKRGKTVEKKTKSRGAALFGQKKPSPNKNKMDTSPIKSSG